MHQQALFAGCSSPYHHGYLLFCPECNNPSPVLLVRVHVLGRLSNNQSFPQPLNIIITGNRGKRVSDHAQENFVRIGVLIAHVHVCPCRHEHYRVERIDRGG